MAMPLRRLEDAIVFVRGKHVMLDWHLAQLYHVPTRVLTQAVKRNIARFPLDFAFRLTSGEFKDLRSQFVISSLQGHGGRRIPPYAFTKQGVAVFVRLRTLLHSYPALERKLRALERKYDRRSRWSSTRVDRIPAAARAGRSWWMT